MSVNYAFDIVDHEHHSCWKASVSDFNTSCSFHRLIVTSCGSRFDVLYGICQDYRWLFLPELQIGCMQADPSDLFWNIERLGSVLNPKDALTIVHAIRFAFSRGDHHG